jgi:hypothetical protein
MNGSIKVRIALTAVATAAIAMTALPANAEMGALGFVGSGSISPGMTLTGGQGPLTWGLSGTGVLVAETVQGPVSCTWTGRDTTGALAESMGTFSGSCNTPAGLAWVSGIYDRSGEVMKLSGTFSSAITGEFDGECDMAYTAWPPQNFEVHCAIWSLNS